ncbi:hypothetical protein [Tenacibaculum jejuense]|uniref:Uncharacterized protein n=1 Tax=Tenacibaculum jejuense TaxID=584609 RepID=A0A238U5H1_9FLAO|nr:hypothetical protein [Tenacibaculum jejuense]SNR14459.1 protein of unknown function [Tenacibaculum jejuense]
MKKIYIQIILFLFIFGITTIQGQFLEPSNVTNDFIDPIGGGDFDIIVPPNPCGNNCAEPNDIDFTFDSSLGRALINNAAIEDAEGRNLRDWYNRQTNRMRQFLSSYYGQNFLSFEDARAYLFRESENLNIQLNLPKVQKVLDGLRHGPDNKKRIGLKGLSALRQRESELRNGNTVNSLYADIKVNGIPLRNLNDIGAINRERNKILNGFIDVLWQSHYHGYTHQVTNKRSFIGEIKDKATKEKVNFYDGQSYWDRLSLMQYLIHTEQIKRRGYVTPAIVSGDLARAFGLFAGRSDIATESFIRRLAQAKYSENMSVFHPDYWKLILKRDYNSSPLHVAQSKSKHEQLKQTELKKFINNTALGANNSVDYLVRRLGIKDEYEYEWLNENASKAIEYKKRIQEELSESATGEYGNALGGDFNFSYGDPNSEIPIVPSSRFIKTDIRNGGLVQKMIEELNITDSYEKEYLYNNTDEANRLRILADQNTVNNSILPEVKDYIKGQTELGGIQRDLNFKFRQQSGKLNNRSDQEYTHFATNGIYNMYQMTDGSRVLESPNRLLLDKNGHFNVFNTTEPSNYKYHYIKLQGEKKWSRYLIKHPTSTKEELETLFELGAVEGAKFIGSYVLPIEDIKIVITGEDFNGQNVSRWKAGGMLILDLAGGKIFKAVGGIIKVGTKQWRIVVKEGNRYYTKVIRAMSEATVTLYNRYGGEAIVKRIDEALRRGELADDIVEEGGEVLKDISEKKGRKLNWEEVKALFKRGIDFNKRASFKYRYNEVTLQGINGKRGKRLDTYIPGIAIISRKATTLSNIKISTFKNYLRELITKYPKGAPINAPKFGDFFKGKVLEGEYFLEIPLSNKTFFENSFEFKKALSDFNSRNNVLIKIIYLAE